MTNYVDLDIRIFQQGDEGYSVEITLGGQQEFPRGHLSAGVLPWTSSGDKEKLCANKSISAITDSL